MMVRDKQGHCAAIVSIQLESCKIRTLISCSCDTTVVGYQHIKVTSKARRPRGTLCSSKDQLRCRAGCQHPRPAAGCQRVQGFQ